jgi:uncharacterized repeat protein (TIGR01451 family)
VKPGGNATYVITLRNNGPETARNVTLTGGALPPGTTFVSLKSPPGWNATTPAVGGTGPVTATSSTLESGAEASFTLVVGVDRAAANGTSLSSTASVSSETLDPDPGNDSVTGETLVFRPNEPPSFSLPEAPDQTVDAGEQTVEGSATGVSPGPPDESGQTVTFLVENNNGSLFSGQPAVSPDGTLTYAPAKDASGTATVSVRLKDDGGTEGGGIDTSAPRSFAITVREVNDPPAATDDAYATDGGRTLRVDAPGVLANHSDPDGDALSAALVSGPSRGELALNADGSFYYTPNRGFGGTDSFTYRAVGGSAESNVATVRIPVRVASPPPNGAPLDGNDSYSTVENRQLVVFAPGVLRNDADPDNDGLGAVRKSAPRHGRLSLNGDGSFAYTPDRDYSGNDSFAYAATDGKGGADTAMVSITVRQAAGPPRGNPNACTIRGTDGNDVLRGTGRRDVICGLGGDDRIYGLGGNDLIRGGSGNDTTGGGAGDDRVYGGGGNDAINGGPGRDRFYGVLRGGGQRRAERQGWPRRRPCGRGQRQGFLHGGSRGREEALPLKQEAALRKRGGAGTPAPPLFSDGGSRGLHPLRVAVR